MFDSILTFLKVMFFSGSTLLTPVPINIGSEPTNIHASEPLEAISEGAGIYINISSYINANSAVDAFKEVKNELPDNCISVTLVSTESQQLMLDENFVTWSDDGVSVGFRSAKGMPTGVKYNFAAITSCKEITNVTVTWVNFSK